jgi:hypothetical protein
VAGRDPAREAQPIGRIINVLASARSPLTREELAELADIGSGLDLDERLVALALWVLASARSTTSAGTSEGGGYAAPGSGTVFKLTRTDTLPYHWNETVIYYFCSVRYCPDGWHPVAELIADKQGRLYGTTQYGGAHSSGTAFQLTPPPAGAGLWTETVLHSFCSDGIGEQCNDGAYPASGLVFDTQGNLYGTAQSGGICYDDNDSCGTVVKLTPPLPGNGATDWTHSVIHSFTNKLQGKSPVAALIVDSQNNLYGTTQFGGAPTANDVGVGTVFKLGPPQGGGTDGTFTILTNFVSNNDDPYTNTQPVSPVTLYQGVLYGTTVYGGLFDDPACENIPTNALGCGSIFKVPLGVGAPQTGRRRPFDSLRGNP